jgi:intraflagellar transport protein 80
MLWACLAAMAVSGKELHTAEVAYAAIDAVDKLLFMSHVKVSQEYSSASAHSIKLPSSASAADHPRPYRR